MEKITPHAFGDLGAKPRPKDKRDYTLGKLQAGVPLPATYFTDLSQIPVYYQRKLPTCGANSGAAVNDVLNAGRVGTPRYLWIKMRQSDHLAPTDGSHIRTILQCLQTNGVCDMSLLGDDTTLDPTTYVDPSVITPAMDQNAATAKSGSYAFDEGSFTMDDLKQYIFQNKVAILRVHCGDGWWTAQNGTTTWQAADILPIRLGNYASDHFVMAYGFDQNYIYFRNSWSDQWGSNGNGFFDASYLPNVIEVGTAVKLPNQYIFHNNLCFGQSSEDVRQLQLRLGVTPTGFFWVKTFIAVYNYQQANGITPTGFVGTLTLAQLNKPLTS